jgi:hypothetical protein
MLVLRKPLKAPGQLPPHCRNPVVDLPALIGPFGEDELENGESVGFRQTGRDRKHEASGQLGVEAFSKRPHELSDDCRQRIRPSEILDR